MEPSYSSTLVIKVFPLSMVSILVRHCFLSY